MTGSVGRLYAFVYHYVNLEAYCTRDLETYNLGSVSNTLA